MRVREELAFLQPYPNQLATGVSILTKIQVTPKWSEVKPQGFYVYTHRRATDGSVFYVGKGFGKRGYSIGARSTHWKNVANKHGVVVSIIKDKMIEQCAYTLEKIVISTVDFNTIVNVSSGGMGGSYGSTKSQKSRELVSIAHSMRVYCSNGMEFRGCSTAARWLSSRGFPRSNDTNISLAARGIRGSAYGFAWSYSCFEDAVYMTPQKRMAISQGKKITSSTGLVFYSTAEAARHMQENGYTNASQQNISAAAAGKRKKAYGLGWKYD